MALRSKLDAAGRRRSPATLPGYLAGRPPRNKGFRYPADPPRVEEIIAVMRQSGGHVHGDRVRGLVVVLWCAGLRIQEALALTESDLDERRGALLVRHGQGRQAPRGRMDDWGWEHLRRWVSHRTQRPVGPLFCVVDRPTRGRAWSPTAARAQLRRLALKAGVRRRFAPQQLRHAHAIEMAHEGVALNIIQRQLGHTDLGVTRFTCRGSTTLRSSNAVHQRRPPMMPASAGLRL